MTDPIGAIRDWYNEHLKQYGCGLAGAVFGCGWWAFLDALVVSDAKIGFAKVRCRLNTVLNTLYLPLFTSHCASPPSRSFFFQYLPGLAATLALVLINAVRWDEISAVDPWDDEGVYCRSRVWLLFAYALALGAIGGATVVMLGAGGGGVGLAAVIQVACVLGGALLLFVSRSEGEAAGDYGLL